EDAVAVEGQLLRGRTRGSELEAQAAIRLRLQLRRLRGAAAIGSVELQQVRGLCVARRRCWQSQLAVDALIAGEAVAARQIRLGGFCRLRSRGFAADAAGQRRLCSRGPRGL